jgi:hypothetical protein
VGNRARNLETNWSPNNTPYGVDGSVVANRRFQQFGTLAIRGPLSHAHYDALQVKYEKRLSKGWYNLTSYTYASGLAEAGYFGSGGGGFQNLNFGPALPLPIFEPGFNEQLSRQRLSVANIYKLPVGRGQRFGGNMGKVADFFIGGWQTQLILTGKSGLPVNVSVGATGTDPLTGRNYAFLPSSGGGQIRPDRVGDPNTGIDPRTDRFRFLDVNAFRLQALNTPGNAARNVAWGPQFWNADIGITKRFPVWEGKSFDFRFEMFNALNHVNFRNPSAVWSASNFGQITDAYPPRQMQVALRFAF